MTKKAETITKEGERVDTQTGEVLPPAVEEAALDVRAKSPLPDNWAQRGATESQWRTMFNLFPGAHPASVLMVWDYCVARRLDPLKKPCHIVKMPVKNHKGVWEDIDVIMPGIYEYRITAHRTGEYMGQAAPVYGPPVSFEHLGINKPVPEWITFTVFRWNPLSQTKGAYAVTVWFEEVCNLVKSTGKANEKWKKSPVQMLTIRGESAALRSAFPDELGGTHTAEEMEGRVIDASQSDDGSFGVVPPPDAGYGPWIEAVVKAAAMGSNALTGKLQHPSTNPAYREHLTMKDKAAWETLKATALAVGP